MLGTAAHRARSMRFLRHPTARNGINIIVDSATGQVLGIMDGRASEVVEDWLFARPLAWRLGMQVLAIASSAAFRKARRI